MRTARPRWRYRSRGAASLPATLVLSVLTPHPRATRHVHAESKLLSVIGAVQKCMNNGKREQCGFTLIEIMIVVVILALLAAIAIPAFSQHSTDAHLSVCFENLRLIQAALTVYRMKAGTYPSSTDGLEGYLRTVPVCPLGGSYNWTLNDDTYHILCTAQHTPSSNHVCIHENQKPTAK